MCKTYVYCLADPRINKVKYVGITKSPKTRLYHHIHDIKRGHTKTNKWILDVLEKGLEPQMRVLKVCDTREEAVDLELTLIVKYKDKHNLTNISLLEGKLSTRSTYNYKRVYVYSSKTGEYLMTFDSYKECSKALGIHRKTIRESIKAPEKVGLKQYVFADYKTDIIPVFGFKMVRTLVRIN